MNDFDEKRLGMEEENEMPDETQTQDTLPEQTEDELFDEKENESTLPEDALEQELEQIRDMFQRSLDGEEIDSSDGEDGADGEPEREYTEEDFCECCGENIRDYSKGDDYPYCEDCTRLMKKTPIGFKGILVILIALVIAGLSTYITITKYSSEADLYALEAQSLADSGKLNSALNSYISYFSSYQGKMDYVGKKAAIRAAKLYAACGYFSDAHDLISNVFTEEELSKKMYAGVKGIEDEYALLNATYDAVYSVISESLNVADPTKVDPAPVLKQLDALKTADPREKDESINAEKYSEFFIEYYKYMVLASTGASLEKQYEQVKKVADMDGAELWAYGGTLCSLAAKLGKEEEAKQIFDKIIAFNSEDPSAYANYANVYRFCEKPDPDKMIEIINKGLNDSNAAESYRLLAVAYLMKGDYEKAFECSTSSYNSSYTLQGIYTHAVCAVMNKDEETYESIEQMLAYYGYSMSDSVKKLKDGKIKLDKLIYDAEGELA
ncbi:MAG: hypothetical protein MJ177_05165 [Clostridia bacterium]|nr:hypothetical protein [Clostridia bacterium]